MPANQQQENWPASLSNPARQALEHAGFRSLEDLTKVSEKQLLNLHGMGPEGIKILRQAMQTAGLRFSTKD